MIKLSDPLPIKRLVRLALDLPEVGWTPEDGDKEELSQTVAKILTDKGEMLKEYFAIDIDENGDLNTLPLLLGNFWLCFMVKFIFNSVFVWSLKIYGVCERNTY